MNDWIDRVLALGEQMPSFFLHRVAPTAREQFFSGLRGYLGELRRERQPEAPGVPPLGGVDFTDEQLMGHALDFARRSGLSELESSIEGGTPMEYPHLKSAMYKAAQAQGVRGLWEGLGKQFPRLWEAGATAFKEWPAGVRRFYSANPKLVGADDLEALALHRNPQKLQEMLSTRQLHRLGATGLAGGALGAAGYGGYELMRPRSIWERLGLD